MRLKFNDWSRCLAVNMKNYISFLCPFRNDGSFVSWWELQPIENFSWLIIFNHFLIINLNKPGRFTNIRLDIRKSFIDPPAQLLLLVFTWQKSINEFILDLYLHRSIILHVKKSCGKHSTLSSNFIILKILILFLFFLLDSKIKCKSEDNCLTVFYFFK